MCRESPCQLGECALSLVLRRGGPSGSPVAATGKTASTTSAVAAIFVPSGDHAGPQPPRESIDSIGSGAYQTSPLSSFRVRVVRLKPDPTAEEERTGIVSTWFVPSRNRRVIGAMFASAT